jgi:hypothetical protein
MGTKSITNANNITASGAIQGGKFYTTNATLPTNVDSVAFGGSGTTASCSGNACAAFLGGTASAPQAMAIIGDATGQASYAFLGLASALNSYSSGLGCESNGQSAISTGFNALAEEQETIAIGKNVVAGVSGGSSATGAIAIGYNADNSFDEIVSTGIGSLVLGSNLEFGRNAGTLQATANGAIVIGSSSASQNLVASGIQSIAIGQDFTNSVANTIGMGFGAKDFTISATNLTWNGIAKFGDGGVTNFTQIDGSGNINLNGAAEFFIPNNKAIHWGTGSNVDSYYDGTDFWLRTDLVAASDWNIDCGTDKTIELQETVYEDLQVNINNIRIPAANAPTERLYNHGIGGGVTFPVLGFDVNDYFYFDLQTSHSMKLSTILDNHIHFMTPTDGSGTPDRFKFQLDVIAAALDGNWAVPTGSPFTAEHIIAADYTNSHKLMEIADIPASNTTVSTIYKCKLTRIAATQDEYGSEVYVEFNDSHYQKNTLGSRQEGVK